MKRKLLFALLSLCGVLCLHPQYTKAQDFRWGLRDGVNVTSLIGIDNTTPRVGLYAGFVGAYSFNERWGLGVDITLSEQGAICNENSDGVTIDYNYNYLNVPLKAHYTLPIAANHSLRFEAGVQLGLFLTGHYEWIAPSVLGEGMVVGEGGFDRDAFHPAEFGLLVGVSWLLGDFALEARYSMGITQTHNGISNTLNGYYYISVLDNRNSVLQLGAAYYF